MPAGADSTRFFNRGIYNTPLRKPMEEKGVMDGMQMWMIAMLAVSAVLIVRDMAKLIFTDRKKGKPSPIFRPMNGLLP